MSTPRIEFVIGGVQKGGTSALWQLLRNHPGICLPEQKEAHLFDDPAFDEQRSRGWLDDACKTLFPHAAASAICGDATPIYLLHPRFIERIKDYNPAMRWILILRDPVERAISHYFMERARGNESWPFPLAMLLERMRLRGHEHDFRLGSPLRRHSYRLRGDYARQLDALYARFPREQVLLLANRELRDDPTGTLRKVSEFLRVAPLPGELRPETVFAGDYAPLPRNSPSTRLLRWLMRNELRAMRERYGIRYDD